MPETDRPRILAPAPLIYLAGFALVLAVHWIWPVSLTGHPGTPWIGRAVLFPGLALNLWGVWSMRRSGTPINPYRPTRVLVAAGPFRISRNPLYTGLHLVLLGLVLILDSLWGPAIMGGVALVMHLGVILPEERYLEARFGERYRRYRATVRRYL